MARDFSGTTQFLDAGDIDATDGVAALSVAGLVKFDTLADFRGVLAKFSSSSSRWGFILGGVGFGTNDDVIITMGNGTNAFGHTTGNIIATGTWYHWLFTYDGGGAANADRLKFYLNGAAQTLTFNGTIPATTPSNAGTFRIGDEQNTAGAYHDGQIAEVAIWLGTLSAGDAAILATRVVPTRVRPDILNNYWPIWGRYTAEIDPVGGANATVTGAAYADHPRVIYPSKQKIIHIPAASQVVPVKMHSYRQRRVA